MPRKPPNVTLEAYGTHARDVTKALAHFLTITNDVLKLQDAAYTRLEARMTVLERRQFAHFTDHP